MKEIVFAIGTGRCGTKFLHEVFSFEPEVASCHERHPLSDTFHRYFKWNNLPIDHQGFLHTKEVDIKKDLEKHKISFESSAYLSFSIKELYEYFNAKFILLVREPEKVVVSYHYKGWYRDPIVRGEPYQPISYQPSHKFHHFLGRTIPNGNEYERWSKLTRIGKLSWFWNTLNKEAVNQLEFLPPDNKLIVKLEDLDYTFYKENICKFLELNSTISGKQFNKTASSKPNSKPKTYLRKDWNETEEAEFEQEIREMKFFFKY